MVDIPQSRKIHYFGDSIYTDNDLAFCRRRFPGILRSEKAKEVTCIDCLRVMKSLEGLRRGQKLLTGHPFKRPLRPR